MSKFNLLYLKGTLSHWVKVTGDQDLGGMVRTDDLQQMVLGIMGTTVHLLLLSM